MIVTVKPHHHSLDSGVWVVPSVVQKAECHHISNVYLYLYLIVFLSYIFQLISGQFACLRVGVCLGAQRASNCCKVSSQICICPPIFNCICFIFWKFISACLRGGVWVLSVPLIAARCRHIPSFPCLRSYREKYLSLYFQLYFLLVCKCISPHFSK